MSEREAEKTREYDKGFLDGCRILLDYANEVLDTVPERRRFSSLVGAIEHVYGCAFGKYQEDVKVRFLITWKPKEYSEKHE